MRIAGLASGMDIEQMVKDLMRAERMPLDKLKQQKQILEWQRDDYRTLNTKLLTFRDKLSQLKLTPNYRARTATSSNDLLVSATVTSGASQASYSISKVEQLASAATRVNAGGISADSSAKVDPTKSLKSQQFENNNFDWQKGIIGSKTINVKEGNQNTIQLELGNDELKNGAPLNVKVNGKTLKVEMRELGENEQVEAGTVVVSSNGTLTFGQLAKDDVVKVDYVLDSKTVDFTYPGDEENPMKIWNVGATSIAEATITIDNQEYKIGGTDGITIDDKGIAKIEGIGQFNTNTGTITFEPPRTEETKISATYTQEYSTFNINTHTSKGEVNEHFFITANDSLNSVIRKVNESNTGVTMFYDSFSDQVTLTRKETGDFTDGDEITVTGSFMEDVLKFAGSEESGGKNAIFTINGLETERNSNTFEMSGVTFTLKQTFNDENAGTQPAVISIGNDTNQVFENIKEFVNQYNELIEEIGKKLNENRYRDYKPLSDEERDQLSEKQQEKWEEMARSGLLKGDSALSSALSSMRLDMSSVVETNGLFKQLASIGIKTTANYMEGGKLEIDEAKLKAALEEDPQSVENLFRGNGETSDRGVVHRLYDTVDATMKKLQEKAGRATSTNQQFTLGRELDNVDKRIDSFEERLKMTENRYWRQFTAMEKAIQQANQQSMYLMQQFGGY